MNFKSSTWRHDGTEAPWKNLKQICFADVNSLKTGIMINNEGIRPL